MIPYFSILWGTNLFRANKCSFCVSGRVIYKVEGRVKKYGNSLDMKMFLETNKKSYQSALEFYFVS